MPKSKPQSLYILVAQDSTVQRNLSKGMLSSMGHKGAAVADSARMRACMGQVNFDAILMDDDIPGEDGLATILGLRAKEKATGTHVPIIVSTRNRDAGYRGYLKRLGADGFVTKPMSADALRSELSRVTTCA